MKVIPDLDWIINHGFGKPTTYQFRANYRWHYLKDFEGALQDETQTIQLMPEHTDGWLIRGHYYYALKRYEEAIADYTQVLNMKHLGIREGFDDSWYQAHLHYCRGRAYYKLNKLQESLNDLNTSARLKGSKVVFVDPLDYLRLMEQETDETF